MSLQADTWVRHTCHFLDGADPALGTLFRLALERAGYPEVSAVHAMEAICADFLAGAPRSGATHP